MRLMILAFLFCACEDKTEEKQKTTEPAAAKTAETPTKTDAKSVEPAAKTDEKKSEPAETKTEGK